MPRGRNQFLFRTDRRLVVDAHHQRNARAVNVTIQQADLRAKMPQRTGEIDRDRGLADAALAAGHGDHAADAGNFVLIHPGVRTGGGRLTSRLLDLDKHALNVRQRFERVFAVRLDLLRDLRIPTGQLHDDAHRALAGDGLFHEAEGHNIP